MESGAVQACPECGASVPVDRGYLPWCEGCGWNVTPPKARPLRDGPLGRVSAGVGRRIGDQMTDRLRVAPRLEPRLTAGKVLAYVIAGGVHGVATAFAAAGIVLIALAFPDVLAIVGGGLLLAVAVLMRPRLGTIPSDHVLARSDVPALAALTEEIAAALETRGPDLYRVDSDYNASWSQLGLRRRRVLTLGAPLLAVLEPQGRVALLAHELAHSRNRDASRGLFVGSAIDGLRELYLLVAPSQAGSLTGTELEIIAPIVRLMLWVVSRPVLGLLWFEYYLLLQDSRRAEYLADALAARVAGTAAVVALHETLLLESLVDAAAHRIVHQRRDCDDFFGDLGELAHAVPRRERERRRRAARLEATRLDVTHPPTGARIRLLEEREPQVAAVVLDAERSSIIDAELAARQPPLARAIVEAYRDSLYAR